jgi:hypothetical protein
MPQRHARLIVSRLLFGILERHRQLLVPLERSEELLAVLAVHGAVQHRVRFDVGGEHRRLFVGEDRRLGEKLRRDDVAPLHFVEHHNLGADHVADRRRIRPARAAFPARDPIGKFVVALAHEETRHIRRDVAGEKGLAVRPEPARPELGVGKDAVNEHRALVRFHATDVGIVRPFFLRLRAGQIELAVMAVDGAAFVGVDETLIHRDCAINKRAGANLFGGIEGRPAKAANMPVPIRHFGIERRHRRLRAGEQLVGAPPQPRLDRLILVEIIVAR